MANTISTLNVVIQQGGVVREIPSDKHQPHDPNKMAFIQELKAKDRVQHTTVQNSEEGEKSKFNENDNNNNKLLLERLSSKNKKKHTEEMRSKGPDEPGNILDTVA